MNDKRLKISIILSIIGGIIFIVLGILLMFMTDIIYFIGISFLGVFFLILLPTRIVKKNSYDVKEALGARERNVMQELCYHYMFDKGIILPLEEYETDSDIGIDFSRIGFIKHENVSNPKEAIYIDMNKKKFVVKYKKNKEKRLFSTFSNYLDVIKEINEIINNF